MALDLERAIAALQSKGLNAEVLCALYDALIIAAVARLSALNSDMLCHLCLASTTR